MGKEESFLIFFFRFPRRYEKAVAELTGRVYAIDNADFQVKEQRNRFFRRGWECRRAGHNMGIRPGEDRESGFPDPAGRKGWNGRMGKRVVAIVGRPNVGKSTLFNKLVGRRVSIVEDTPGVTRDRIYAPCEWRGTTFLLADTGGIDLGGDAMLSRMRAQAQVAIDSADVIVMVTDLRSGPTAQDTEVAAMLRRSGRPVVLCVNKVDSLGAAPPEIYEFYSLGLGDPYAVSSVHGHGTGDLLDRVLELLPPEPEEATDDDAIRVAVIGKPNVGKSSLINYIAGEERVLVADEPGTTRDAVDMAWENDTGRYIWIDTAGIRRHSRVEDDVERYSVLRSYAAVDRATVCVILLDAREGFTAQDSKIAGYAHQEGKACIIAVNKWDLMAGSGVSADAYCRKLRADFSFMPYAPILCISAKTGHQVDRLFSLIRHVDGQNAMRVPTGRLNDVLADAIARVQPPSDKGRRLKILYMTQASVRPPTFVVFVNRQELFHFSYQRYLENQLRATFGLEGTPVRFVVRQRDDRA